jgi:hypothetical protein
MVLLLILGCSIVLSSALGTPVLSAVVVDSLIHSSRKHRMFRALVVVRFAVVRFAVPVAFTTPRLVLSIFVDSLFTWTHADRIDYHRLLIQPPLVVCLPVSTGLLPPHSKCGLDLHLFALGGS